MSHAGGGPSLPAAGNRRRSSYGVRVTVTGTVMVTDRDARTWRAEPAASAWRREGT